MHKSLEKRNVSSAWIEERIGGRLGTTKNHFVITGRESANGAKCERLQIETGEGTV